MLRFAGEFGLTPVGAANVSGLIEHDGKIECPRVLVRATVHNVPKAQAAVAYTELVDPAALVAYGSSKIKLIAALDREIASEADDKAALTPEAR